MTPPAASSPPGIVSRNGYAPVVPTGRPSSYGAQGIAPREDVPSLSTGDSVKHGTLGEGVVTQIEAGGVVTVRFADGAERRLMLEYAPLERI